MHETMNYKEKSPRVTVLILTYNHENYIKECLNSVISLNNIEAEIIIMDDNSTDNTLTYIREVCANSPRITIIANDVNTGDPARNTQRLVDAAQTDFLLFLSGDDLLSSFYDMKRVLSYITEDDCIDAVIPRMQFIMPDIGQNPPDIYDESLLEGLRSSDPKTILDLHFFRKVSRVFLQGCLIRKRAIDEMGGFYSGTISDDYAFMVRFFTYLSRENRIFKFDEESLWLYRVHGSNTHRNAMRQFSSILEVVKKYIPTEYIATFMWDGTTFQENEELTKAVRLAKATLGNEGARRLVDLTANIALSQAAQRRDKRFMRQFMMSGVMPFGLRITAASNLIALLRNRL